MDVLQLVEVLNDFKYLFTINTLIKLEGRSLVKVEMTLFKFQILLILMEFKCSI
jgi:hypothetical protein